MDFSLYKMSPLEEWIYQKYMENGIQYASDLELDRISYIFNAEVICTKAPSHVQWDDEYCLIFINDALDEPNKRAVFFHELCHPVLHHGNQRFMPSAFRELQEIQASHFQLYSAMPIYMLKQFQNLSAPAIAEEFNLPLSLVQTRLQQIHERIQHEKSNRQFIAKIKYYNKETNSKNWSPETKRILDKLYKQILKKGAANQ
ncbi:ImmA/IrrE family metallo-endopeptidase [Microaerobacter geothermalis]|uniref:ImmA/IrrE family metallo-endopeptidase n=1 Tax=Microaerobacter geothermalis TaxID=674972 RepID=UPI001F308884|nr:ImmA/IrrE family metallo-endopeptidase [Microaerobacter geothermalis]MCF6094335.1 ImmA/IrrE family metallo-endopeptidase [Microaerobacter geothermalis]